MGARALPPPYHTAMGKKSDWAESQPEVKRHRNAATRSIWHYANGSIEFWLTACGEPMNLSSPTD